MDSLVTNGENMVAAALTGDLAAGLVAFKSVILTLKAMDTLCEDSGVVDPNAIDKDLISHLGLAETAASTNVRAVVETSSSTSSSTSYKPHGGWDAFVNLFEEGDTYWAW